jgi:hypothetical protein
MSRSYATSDCAGCATSTNSETQTSRVHRPAQCDQRRAGRPRAAANPDLDKTREVLEDFTIFWKKETDLDGKRHVLATALCQPRRVARTAALGHGPRLLRHPARVIEGPPQQHLDVGVEAAELVSGPPGQGIVDHRVDAQQHLFALMAHV